MTHDTGGPTRAPDGPEHTDVGAYALGVLGPAEAERFEEHLAGCPRCAAELEELTALTPLLAEERERGVPEPPPPALLGRLLGEAAAERRTRRTRRMWLVAAAFALIVGGPVATLAATGDEAPRPGTVNTAQQMWDHGEKHGTTDASTGVSATVSMLRQPWGTHVGLKLGGVRGPLTCELVAVGPRGSEQTVTTWTVPRGGYGTQGGGDAWAGSTLYAHGGAGFDRSQISAFVVRTLDGRKLATVRV
ncbi:zf-HC2 domain-containing protein [Streptomyces sp. ODS28]|uniref:anti-sigma factor family protein n=1 Tax=Streptomyces sp. ODS28 TaxID=3136688 RepID=UPI0031EE4252